MKPAPQSGWQAHEIVWVVLWSATAGRLLAQGGASMGWGLALLGLCGVQWALVRWANQQPAEWPQRVRLFIYLFWMVLTYKLLGIVVPQLHPGSTLVLAHADEWLFGQDFGRFLEPWTTPVLTDLFFVLYGSFFTYIAIACWHYGRGDLDRLRRFMAGLFTVYGIGFMGYTLLPAGGPYLEIPDHFTVPLTGSWITQMSFQTIIWGSDRVDCFPCLHLGITLFILVFDYWYCRRRFWWVLLPCIGIWISTLYLRQHYAVDLLGGLALTSLVLWWVRRSAVEQTGQLIVETP
jgi:hypothetical protein